jgi:hypothetical protein
MIRFSRKTLASQFESRLETFQVLLQLPGILGVRLVTIDLRPGIPGQEVQGTDPDIRSDIDNNSGFLGSRCVIPPAEYFVDRQQVMMAETPRRDEAQRRPQLHIAGILAAPGQIAAKVLDRVRIDPEHSHQGNVVLSSQEGPEYPARTSVSQQVHSPAPYSAAQALP